MLLYDPICCPYMTLYAPFCSYMLVPEPWYWHSVLGNGMAVQYRRDVQY